jgi:hypothetical protein
MTEPQFLYGHEYWFHQYRRQYSVYIAEAIREHRKFSLLIENNRN